jgi:hypothetical protein
MKSVSQVLLAVIVPDFGICYKFKVNPVPLASQVIFRHEGSGAFPQMNAISTVLFFFDDPLHLIARNPAIVGIGEIDPEIAIDQTIVFQYYPIGRKHFDPRYIHGTELATVADLKPLDIDIRSGHGNWLAIVLTVYNRRADSNQHHRFINGQITFGIDSFVYKNGVSGLCLSKSGMNACIGLSLADRMIGSVQPAAGKQAKKQE